MKKIIIITIFLMSGIWCKSQPNLPTPNVFLINKLKSPNYAGSINSLKYGCYTKPETLVSIDRVPDTLYNDSSEYYFDKELYEYELSLGMLTFGYQFVPEYDTVKANILTTYDIDKCIATSIRGYVRRQKQVYFGDRMPNGSDYSDRWIVIDFFDKNKQPLPDGVLVWDFKIKL